MRIVLASILKPIDDTRMFEKLALSLAETNKYEINIIGFGTKVTPAHPTIRFYPLYHFKRLSWGRAWAPVRFFRKLMALKPALVIIGTYELLVPAVLYRLFFGSKLIYDVQEDYKQNLQMETNFIAWGKWFLGWLVRALEHITRPWVDHYLLAEVIYQKDLSFVRGKSTVLLNKFRKQQPLPQKFHNNGHFRFIYSGTIATVFGIFKALDLFEAIHELHPATQLVIVGYAADPKVLVHLEQRIEGKPEIRLLGGSQLVPHQTLLQQLAQANCALVPYQKKTNVINRFPTKIFECLALGLPMVLQNHPPWVTLCHQAEAAVPIDFDAYDPLWVWQQLQERKFYPQGPPKEVFWSQEETTLQRIVTSLIPAPQ